MAEQSQGTTVVETGPLVMSHGILGWLRANLFNSVFNAIISILLLALLLFGLTLIAVIAYLPGGLVEVSVRWYYKLKGKYLFNDELKFRIFKVKCKIHQIDKCNTAVSINGFTLTSKAST